MTTLDLITREDLQQFKSELLSELKTILTPSANSQPAKKWMKSAEVRRMLNISPGTLQSLRINGTIRFSKVGSMMFYKVQDIDKLLEDGFDRNPSR